MSKENTKENIPPKALSKVAEAKLRAKEEERRNKALDKIKLLIGFIVLSSGVFAYYALPTINLFLRIAFPVAGVLVFLAIVFFWCAFGRNLLAFVRDATQELRKVVWPERPTTLRMTIMVLLFVAVLAIFIWLADSLISWIFFDLFLKRG